MKTVKATLEHFETSRLILEPLNRHHAVYFFNLLQDKRIYDFIPTSPPKTVDDLIKRYTLLEDLCSPDKTEIWLNWAVRLKNIEPLEYIGRVEATVYKDLTAKIAYEPSSNYWSSGYAEEMCRELLDILRTEYQVRKFVANIDTLNMKSISLIKKIGFKLHKKIENADYFNGRQSDEYVFYLEIN